METLKVLAEGKVNASEHLHSLKVFKSKQTKAITVSK
jgi:hypothetical protein